MSINKCFLAGNLTAEPQLRATPGGMAILEFGLAVNERRKNQQTGEWTDRPNYFDLKVFGRRAEALSTILTKGMHVSIEGRLQWSSWEDKNTGQKRSKIEVIVDEVELMSQRQQAGQFPNAPQSAPQAPYAPHAAQQYANPPQQQMAPQMPAQAPQMGYQQQMPMPQAPQPSMYEEDIPF